VVGDQQLETTRKKGISIAETPEPFEA